MSGQSLFDKVWQDHVVVPEGPNNPTVLYIDLHLIHEVTTPQAFTLLRELKLPVRRPDLTLATMDHSTPTVPVPSLADLEVVAETRRRADPRDDQELRGLRRRAGRFRQRIPRHRARDRSGTRRHPAGQDHRLRRQPLVHARRLRRAGLRHRQHRGGSRAGHTDAVTAQTEDHGRQRRRQLRPGVGAKDIILAIIGQIGVDGGVGHAIEFRGSAIRALSMEERMTICNMTIEGGARAGMIAPDDTTIEFLAGRPRVPAGRRLGRRGGPLAVPAV